MIERDNVRELMVNTTCDWRSEWSPSSSLTSSDLDALIDSILDTLEEHPAIIHAWSNRLLIDEITKAHENAEKSTLAPEQAGHIAEILKRGDDD